MKGIFILKTNIDKITNPVILDYLICSSSNALFVWADYCDEIRGELLYIGI